MCGLSRRAEDGYRQLGLAAVKTTIVEAVADRRYKCTEDTTAVNFSGSMKIQGEAWNSLGADLLQH